jgi:hypothetical protein
VGPAALSLLMSLAHANFGGRVGHAAEGCGDCHGDAADPDVVAALEGPASARPGEAVALRLVLTSSDARHVASGVNVAASAGGLRPGLGQRSEDGEITHDRRQDLVDGERVFEFTWTAPAAAGPHTVWAAGNAVDARGTARGDGWAVASPLSIAVECPSGACPEPDTGGGGGETADPVPEAARSAGPRCGPGLPASGAAALVALGLALGRRRG